MDLLAPYIDRLIEDQVEAILREARSQAEARLARASRELEAMEEEALRRAEAQARVERARHDAQVRRAIKERLLQVAHQVVSQAVEEARRRLREAYREKRATLLPRLAREILTLRQGEEPVRLRVHPEDYPILQKALKDSAVQVVSDPEVNGGVVGEFPSRGLRVSNTLESRLERARDLLLEHFYEVILPGEDLEALA